VAVRTLSSEELGALTEPRLVTDVPGPRALEEVERDARVTSPSLPRAYPLVPVRGSGSIVEDVDGNAFLDFNAGIAVTSTGHSHPDVVAAITEQAGRLLHYSASDFFLPSYTEVCEVLGEIAPMAGPTRSFLTNSGTEGVEAAIKLARYHTGRQYLIAFFGAFHGRSYGSVSLTASKSSYHQGFGPLLPGVLHAPYGEGGIEFITERLFARLVPPTEVAAIVMEPVQGEGGYVVPPRAFVEGLRELCDRHGILLVADEVQSGMGRTGRMWAMEHFGVQPDILVSGKGIASGMPLGAMTAHADVMSWAMGAHGSTYGGSPLSCAAALATIALLRGGLVDRAARVGGSMLAELAGVAERHASVREVRGLGMMIGVEFESDTMADAVEIACFKRGLLVLRAGEATVRIAPPLVLTDDQAGAGLRIFEDAVGDVEAQGPAAFHPIVPGHEAGPGTPEGT
jgi:4-aminobutyrate aminotransferase